MQSYCELVFSNPRMGKFTFTTSLASGNDPYYSSAFNLYINKWTDEEILNGSNFVRINLMQMIEVRQNSSTNYNEANVKISHILVGSVTVPM